MKQVRWSWLATVLAASVLIVAAEQAAVREGWAAPKGTLRVAVVNFDRESTAQRLGATPMLP